MPLTLFGLSPVDLADDVYFKEEWTALHAFPDSIDSLRFPGFSHSAAVRSIPGTKLFDLETPHAYGGPWAGDSAALIEGLGLWRQRQRQAGRVAEFIRLHPFIDAARITSFFDHLEVNRPTVVVDLRQSSEQRRSHYNKGARHALRRAERLLTLRRLAVNEAPLFQSLYETVLRQYDSAPAYWFPDAYYRNLFAAPWCEAWLALHDNKPVAAACFLISGPVLHYHLAGGSSLGRDTDAAYLLLENAFCHYAEQGAELAHLGGGRTTADDDSLLAFKAKFSPLQTMFHTAGLIHNHDAYKRLGGAANGRMLGYRLKITP